MIERYVIGAERVNTNARYWFKSSPGHHFMTTIECKDCGDEIDDGEALNGYCDCCVEKFMKEKAKEILTIPEPVVE